MATIASSIDRFPSASLLDRARAIQNGLPVDVLRAMLSDGTVRIGDLVGIVAKRRTLDRRLTEDDFLTLEEGDRFTRFAEVLELASHIFGSREAAMEWLRAPQYDFDGTTPLLLMQTHAGAGLVENLLARFRHGMLA